MIFDEHITIMLSDLGFVLLENDNLTDKYLQITTLDSYVTVTFDKIVEVENLLGYDFLCWMPASTLTFKKVTK
jgi:hypothetical protein